MLNTDPTPAHVLTWKKPSTNWLKSAAMKHALALALSNDFERVIFESDCQQ
ncbi:hypothetical protein L195_g060341, partial [Trifolium pratense]